ncbi:MAG: bifunctional folylpolyglutamate synthase/dihydrofolate synthase, partial [Anaerolineae bacterium]|nr:bifunctional folylpolyglutamate synthase/dihydrofolate synthase [Anaerolineae bacterium]
MEETTVAYQEALDYLYSLVDYSLTRSFRYSPEKFDLNRMREFLTLLGNPEKDFRCIHVAGTKGKGSVSAFIANSLQTAGYKTGLYTSPHLSDYCERIQINHQSISHEDFELLINELKPVIARIQQLSTFEVTTAMAFLHFSRQKVDAAVVEVGLGGRLDATNVVDPVAAVITSISYDHMAVLGNTLELIAAEKGGIIKTGRPVISSPQKAEVDAVLSRITDERSAPIYRTGEDYLFESVSFSLDGQSFSAWNVKEGENSQKTFSIPLLGKHQVENAVTALAALRVANDNGLPVTDEDIKKGFASVVWPGRFELLSTDPYVVVDSAHNRDSARRLRETLDDYFPKRDVLLV